MGGLSSDEILKDKQTSDPESIISLSLTQKIISDVSCLRDFKNLEKLDLNFNSLTSLEDLRECVNLKWLSVVQNKLQSLKGIEGLTKLTVLNVGKNKIRSVDEVQKLVNLRALIMNDNEIVSICRLDELKYLNTIVVSRNPLRKLSLDKLKLMSKLSLSNCQLESIDVSIKVCTELKELRLAHNDIKTLPDELAHNTKLQNLDLGNNLISRWSDLKVLSSLQRLKNLNLHGNPVAENDKLMKKIKKLVPSIRIYNSKLIEKHSKKEEGANVLDFCVSDAHVLVVSKKAKERDHHEGDESKHSSIGKRKNPKELVASGENGTNSAQEGVTENNVKTDLKGIDDRDTPFWELVSSDTTAVAKRGKSASVGEFDSLSNLVIVPAKKKKLIVRTAELQSMPQGSEVGLGGLSAWDDDK